MIVFVYSYFNECGSSLFFQYGLVLSLYNRMCFCFCVHVRNLSVIYINAHVDMWNGISLTDSY